MKINSTYLDGALTKLMNMRFVLVYGQEEGQIRLVSQKIQKLFLQNSDPDFNLVIFDFKQLRDDLVTLKNEMASLSLMGGNKIIVIESCPATVAKDFQEVIKKPTGTAKVIMVSDDLKPASSLRKLFETETNCAAVACYKDDEVQMSRFICQYLNNISVKYDNAVPMALASILPANRMLVVNELEKLAVYCNNARITMEDVSKAISEGKELLLDALCLAVFKRNYKVIPKLLNTMISEDTSFVLIIRVLLRYSMRLLEIKGMMMSGASAEEAVAALRPPVFFKQKDSLVSVAQTTSDAKLYKMIKKLLQLELDCKSGKLDPQLLTHNFLVFNAIS